MSIIILALIHNIRGAIIEILLLRNRLIPGRYYKIHHFALRIHSWIFTTEHSECDSFSSIKLNSFSKYGNQSFLTSSISVWSSGFILALHMWIVFLYLLLFLPSEMVNTAFEDVFFVTCLAVMSIYSFLESQTWYFPWLSGYSRIPNQNDGFLRDVTYILGPWWAPTFRLSRQGGKWANRRLVRLVLLLKDPCHPQTRPLRILQHDWSARTVKERILMPI